MNHSVLSKIISDRLTPQVFHFLKVSGHTVTIWDIDTSPYSFVIVYYDETDLITALWVHNQCSCRGGGQFHFHLCPAEIQQVWAHQASQGIPIRPPYRVTFSAARAQPYDCPCLNEVRAERAAVIQDALRQRACLLPGPRLSAIIRPPRGLRHLFPGVFSLPEAPENRPRPTDLSLSK